MDLPTLRQKKRSVREEMEVERRGKFLVLILQGKDQNEGVKGSPIGRCTCDLRPLRNSCSFVTSAPWNCGLRWTYRVGDLGSR